MISCYSGPSLVSSTQPNPSDLEASAGLGSPRPDIIQSYSWVFTLKSVNRVSEGHRELPSLLPEAALDLPRASPQTDTLHSLNTHYLPKPDVGNTQRCERS